MGKTKTYLNPYFSSQIDVRELCVKISIESVNLMLDVCPKYVEVISKTFKQIEIWNIKEGNYILI